MEKVNQIIEVNLKKGKKIHEIMGEMCAIINKMDKDDPSLKVVIAVLIECINRL